jgi:hypothetical protein
MDWSQGFNALFCRAPRSGMLLMAAVALALAGCNHDGQPTAAMAQPRGATVAFDSIDGLPPGQFQTLVKSLNDEAQSRRLAVISRDSPSAYRVRGYIAAKVVKDQTTIAWVWDVFDGEERRALRIAGETTAKGRHRDAWAAADEAMMNRIARASMEQLASFLTSAEAAPGVSPATAETTLVAFAGQRDSSPESAGIYRIFQAHTDPVGAGDDAGPVPLPRRRPAPVAALSAPESLTLSAARHSRRGMFIIPENAVGQ